MFPFSNIQAVALDAVGTVLHPAEPVAAVYARVGARHGSRLAVDEIRQRFSEAFADEEKIDAADAYRTSEERELRRWRDLVAQVIDDATAPDACFGELYRHYAQPESWVVDTDLASLIERLRASGFGVALASNFDLRLHAIVEVHSVFRLFDSLVISSEVGWRKPAPAFYRAVAKSLDVEPGRMLMVGDDLRNDAFGARACGIPAVLFDPKKRYAEWDGPKVTSLLEVAELVGL